MSRKGTALPVVIAAFVCLGSVVGGVGASTPTIGSPVVTTAWLADHLSDPDLVVLHVGQKGSFEEGHIPGALSASLRRLIRVNKAGIRDEMPATAEIAEALSELGIGASSQVVVYFADEQIAWAAARYLLTLEYAGMAGRAAYLDGGLPAWIAEDRPVSAEAPVFEKTDLEVVTAPGVVVGTEWLQARLGQPRLALIDARPPEGYSGVSGHWERPGHIPGARNIPFFDVLAENPPYLLKTRQELSELYRGAGVHEGDLVVVYCGTGLWGSLPYLAARVLDYDVRLYDGSFQEWIADTDRPVTKPAQAGGDTTGR